MTSRRADATPGLLDRVRWGNVGRLVALLVGVILLVTGPHGCGKSTAHGGQRTGLQPRPPALPQALKPAAPKPSVPVVRPRRRHRRRHRHHVRRHRHARAKSPLSHARAVMPVVGPAAPPSPPLAAPPPAAAATGEFAP